MANTKSDRLKFSVVSASAAKIKPFSVMSWNLQWYPYGSLVRAGNAAAAEVKSGIDYKSKAVKSVLNDLKTAGSLPSILCLQEVAKNDSMDKTLSSFGYTNAMWFDIRKSSSDPAEQGLYLATNYKYIQHWGIDFASLPDEPNKSPKRGILAVLLNAGKKNILIYVAHFADSTDIDAGISDTEKAKQQEEYMVRREEAAKYILSDINDIKKEPKAAWLKAKPDVYILCGSLNVPAVTARRNVVPYSLSGGRKDKTFDILTGADGKFVHAAKAMVDDTSTVDNGYSGWTTTRPVNIAPGIDLDHIMIRDEQSLLGSGTPKVINFTQMPEAEKTTSKLDDYSDHNPVMVSFSSANV